MAPFSIERVKALYFVFGVARADIIRAAVVAVELHPLDVPLLGIVGLLRRRAVGDHDALGLKATYDLAVPQIEGDGAVAVATQRPGVWL
jgi:hypothetical protein